MYKHLYHRLLPLILALVIYLSVNTVYAEQDLNRNGLASWWIGNGNENDFIEYMNGVDDIYTRVPNEIGLITGNGLAEVICGHFLNSWLDNMDGQSKYFSLFCDLIERAYGTSSFTNIRVELIYSETYGWSENGDELFLCDEFYLFRMTYPDGSWDDICIRMFCEIGQIEMIHGRLYNSFKVQFSDDEASTSPEDTEPMPDAIYYPEMYIVNCNEWVSLREHRDTSSRRLAKVPLGSVVRNCYESGNDAAPVGRVIAKGCADEIAPEGIVIVAHEFLAKLNLLISEIVLFVHLGVGSAGTHNISYCVALLIGFAHLLQVVHGPEDFAQFL